MPLGLALLALCRLPPGASDASFHRPVRCEATRPARPWKHIRSFFSILLGFSLDRPMAYLLSVGLLIGKCAKEPHWGTLVWWYLGEGVSCTGTNGWQAWSNGSAGRREE